MKNIIAADNNMEATYQFTTRQKIYLPFKRLIGIFSSIVGIVVCTVLLWWWVIPINLIVTKGHPFFNRHRIGRDGKPFICLKLRTMKLDTDPHMSSTGGDRDVYLTGFGRFLRKTSIDETVQLFNIFVGQMAFIGPRPLIDVNEKDVITVDLRKENGSISLRPGISGFAQIHEREKLSPEKKAQYDYEYMINMSLWFDTKIFVKTLINVLFVSGCK